MPIDNPNRDFTASASADASRHDDEQGKVRLELERHAQEEALKNGSALMGLFEALPAAVLASERAEYERVVARDGKGSARAQALEASLDHLEGMEMLAVRGRARAARAMDAARSPGTALHGFVTDERGEPVAGITVRVVPGREGRPLESRTELDGYFRVPLPPPAAAAAAESQGVPAQIVLLDGKGSIVHEDPLPLDLGKGAAYREYLFEARGPVRGEKDRETTRRAKPKKG